MVRPNESGGSSLAREERHFAGFVAGARRASHDLADEEHLVDRVDVPRRISLLVVVDRRELERARLETGLFGNFPHHALARGLIDVGPTAGQRPFAVADLAHHQNAALDEGRAAHVDLRGRVALLLAQQLEQGFMFGGRTLRHQHGRQFAQPLVALLVEAVGAEGQSGLSNGPHLACDFQPLRFLSHRGAKNSVYVAMRSAFDLDHIDQFGGHRRRP